MSTTSPSAGRRIIGQRYELITPLGHGGMGTVLRGHDLEIQRPVAIKKITFTGLSEHERDGVRQRMLREVRAAGRLHHPAVVTLFDVLLQEDAAYIVMELVDAATLAHLLKRTGPLPLERAAAIALDILDGLEAAHRVNLVHRDVKPSNIMVPAHGTAKLTDFGIVHMLEDSQLTETGKILGSPAYLAPEQISHGPITPATDLFQLGVTLYAMLEGQSPFDRQSQDLSCYAVLGYTPQPPSCGGPLAEILIALLNKDAARRPDAATLRSMLRQYTTHAQSSTPRESLRTQRLDVSPPARPRLGLCL